MLVHYTINGVNREFGYTPQEPVYIVEIRTTGLPILIPIEQMTLAKTYLKSLVNNMSNDGYVLYNGVLIYKNDINLDI